MANYKRKRPRTSGTHSPFNKRKPPDIYASYPWWHTWPRAFDILEHTRRRRREAAEIIRAVLLGKIDPDNAAWPDSKKPTQYFW